jgi:hypothetical protein
MGWGMDGEMDEEITLGFATQESSQADKKIIDRF